MTNSITTSELSILTGIDLPLLLSELLDVSCLQGQKPSHLRFDLQTPEMSLSVSVAKRDDKYYIASISQDGVEWVADGRAKVISGAK